MGKGEMTLIELIDVLKTMPQDKVVRWGFDHPHSWRGVYDELAFEPAENVTIGSMLHCAREALHNTYQGYKGGDFTMGEYTEVHIAYVGSGDDLMGELLLRYMEAA